jgi:hypothetical protein
MEKDSVGTWRLTGQATVDRIFFDKGLNDYRHTVWDRKTMEVIYDQREPLSEHRGRGSAKQQRGD